MLELYSMYTDGKNRLTLYWTKHKPSAAWRGAITYSVELSGSPAGPWVVAASGITASTFDGDISGSLHNTLALRPLLFCRVTAALADGTVEHSRIVDVLNQRQLSLDQVGPVGLVPEAAQTHPNPTNLFEADLRHQKRKFLVSRALQRRAAINLHKFTGVRVLLFKPLRYGPVCPACSDPVTGTAQNSQCYRCYGTGFDGGIHDPMRVYVRITEAPPQTGMQTAGVTTTRQAQVDGLPFPPLASDDILVELDSGRRWIVVAKVAQQTLHRAEVLQSWACSELSKSAHQYLWDADVDEIVNQHNVFQVDYL